MREEQLVLIEVTYQDEQGVSKYRTGTGYYITSNLILTSDHLLPAGPVEEINVRIEKNGKWVQAHVNPVWKSELRDAALLFTNHTVLNIELDWQETRIEGDVNWGTTAYPAAASITSEKGTTTHSTRGLSGILHGSAGGGQLEVKLLDLEVTSPPKDLEKWRGISGAPVFVNGKLVGIIRKAPASFDQRLEGIPTFELFKDAGFIATIENQWQSITETDLWSVMLLAENADEEALCEPAEAALRESFGEDVVPMIRFKITDVLTSPGKLLQFISILCKAPILFMDATGFQPGILLLMGIRGVVRRSVTIVVTMEIPDQSNFSDLPFNIQEIKLVSLDESSSTSGLPVKDRLKAAILEGRAQSRINPHYLDLPPYESVRNPVIFDIPAIREKALILCSFRADYRRHFELVRSKVSYRVETSNILRMLDINSPQLVGQSLHEHIRWARRCVIDWSFWQPNVFYELGVRLAASSIEPFHLLEEKSWEQDKTENKAIQQKQMLFALFSPHNYVLATRSFPIEEMRAHFEYALGKSDLIRSELDHHSVQPGNIYQAAEKNYDWSQDNIAVPPHLSIKNRIEREFGKDTQATGSYNVLYSSNEGFKNAIQNHIRELWLSAWYYLLNRYTMDEFRTNKEKADELKSIANSLLDVLDVEVDLTLMKEIVQIKKQL